MTHDGATGAQAPEIALGARESQPLTERILSALPGPRPLWVVLWVSVPWLHLGTTQVLRSAGLLPPEEGAARFLTGAAFSFSVAMALWGTARIAAGARSLRSRLPQLVTPDEAIEPFGGIDGSAVPLLLTAFAAMVFGWESIAEHDSWVRALLTTGSWLLIGVASWTFVWVYLTLQVGLRRLGRLRLSLDAYPNDFALGVRPAGTVAFTGFWTLVVTLTPLLLVTSSNRLALGVGLIVLLAGVATFFLSLRGLNRQMVAAKRRELARARRLYSLAFQPVRDEPTLETLERHAVLLSAAEALEKRAERIQEWPFDERTVARVVAIATSVLAAILVQVLLAPFGS